MAIAATAVWELRTTGADTNGGGFDPGVVSPGTDFSQQTAAQIAFTDLVIGATTTNLTSVLNPFGSTHVGNFIQITSGTNFTTGIYEIVSVSGVIATMDRSVGTAASTGGHGNLGGCLASPGKVASVAVAGNLIYMKATATYSISTAVVPTNSGSAGSPIIWIGYTTTRGDNGQVTIQTSAPLTSGLFNLNALSYHNWFNLIFDANAQTNTIGCNAAVFGYVYNCKAINFKSAGFFTSNASVTFDNCVASGGAGTAGFENTNVCTFINCRATGNTCTGFLFAWVCVAITCISDNNTGASSDGFQFGSVAEMQNMRHCVAYKNGRDGFRLNGSSIVWSVKNCISVMNSGWGFNSTTNYGSALAYLIVVGFNAYYSNTSGQYNQVPAGTSDVTLTGDPFTNGSSNDFSLNSTAGAGAACRAAGFPGVLQSGGTGYVDIGALQHPDPATTPTAVIAQAQYIFEERLS
jgi:hypothetical protein